MLRRLPLLAVLLAALALPPGCRQPRPPATGGPAPASSSKAGGSPAPAGLAARATGLPAAATAAPRPPGTGGPTRSAATAPTGAKHVAVTIDDGPALKYVLAAMDAAEANGSRITFFVTGRHLSRDPQIARRIRERGHQIGNHTWDHVALAKCSPDRIRDQLSRTNDLIVKSGGDRPTVYRPPYGSHNARVDGIAAQLGLRPAMWDIDPQDWSGRPGAQTLSTVFSQLRPGAVILIHEVHNTYLILPQLFAGLRQRGYVSVRLDQLPRFRHPTPRP